jgi:tetratricopeptide (TPR) repeat protein
MSTTPQTPEADDLLGRTLLEAARARPEADGGQHAALAATFFMRARALGPDIPALAYHVGLCKMAQGLPRQAVRFLEQSLREEPELDAALPALVRALRHLKAKKAVLQLLEPMEKDGTLPPLLHAELAWARTPDDEG